MDVIEYIIDLMIDDINEKGGGIWCGRDEYDTIGFNGSFVEVTCDVYVSAEGAVHFDNIKINSDKYFNLIDKTSFLRDTEIILEVLEDYDGAMLNRIEE